MRRLQPILFLLTLTGCNSDSGPQATNQIDDVAIKTDVGIDLANDVTQTEEPTFNTPQEAFDAVNPFIGTGGVGFAYAAMTPAAQVPFGLVKLGPDTTANNSHPSNIHHFSGYYFGDPQVRGFSHTHFVGTGAADYGNLRVLPTTLATLEAETPGRAYETVEKSTEDAEPGFYTAHLPDADVTVELTATQLVGLHRYTFNGVNNALAIDVAASVTDSGVVDSNVQVSGNTIEGLVTYGGPLTGRSSSFTLYFHGSVSATPSTVYVWDDAGFQTDATAAMGTATGAVLVFDDPTTVELKIGVSLISIENAKTSHDEVGDFDAVRDQAKSLWLEKLSRLRVAGGTAEQQSTFFTALYNTYRMPTQIDEHGAYATIDGEVGVTTERHFTDLSLWDSYRTLHPWYTVFDPEAARDVLNSLLRMANDGGMLPRWPAALSFSGAMEGTSADILFAEGALKGIDGVDYATAYTYARQTAMGSVPGVGFGGREGIDAYLELGWVPADEFSGGASNVLEYAVDDFALANLAGFLDETADEAIFRDRATWYQNIWHEESGFFRPRNRDGSVVEPFSATSYSERSGIYTEGSAWHWLFYVPHDGAGLVELIGGRQAFDARLTEFMEKSKLFGGDNTKLLLPDPYYWHTNQPSLHAPFLFAASENWGQLAHWIQQIQTFAYTTNPDGLVGNDDGGTLSAWHLLAGCGFYPIVGSDRYVPSPPLFDRMEMTLQNGETLVVSKHSSETFEARIGGQTKREFTHGEFAFGGEIEFSVPD